eukprot:5122374-Prymnesium_polylepis.1
MPSATASWWGLAARKISGQKRQEKVGGGPSPRQPILTTCSGYAWTRAKRGSATVTTAAPASSSSSSFASVATGSLSRVRDR